MSGQEPSPEPAELERSGSDRIEMRGLRVLGTHGVLPEEQQRAQPFEVDLDLEVDLRRAGWSDRLDDTVDYGAVTAAVAAVVGGAHSDLLEHLAERIAAAALEAGAPHAASVTISVRKTRPPVPSDLASAGVTIHRRRPNLPRPNRPDRPAAGAG
jgi:dihydroneopterin aldolase